jgi:hypothetical protein
MGGILTERNWEVKDKMEVAEMKDPIPLKGIGVLSGFDYTFNSEVQ